MYQVWVVMIRRICLLCLRSKQVLSIQNSDALRRLILVGILVGLAACTPGIWISSTEAPKSQTPTHLETPVPFIASPTLRTPSPKVTPVSSGTTTNEGRKGLSCSQLIDHPSAQTKLEGQLVLKPRLQLPFLLDLSTKTQIPLAEDKGQRNLFDRFAASPDGKWLAYNTYPPDPTAFIQSADGQQKKRFPEPWNDNIAIIGWLDNQQIALLHFTDQSPFSTTVILNPFTGSWNEYRLEDLNNYALSMGARNLYFESSNLMPDPSQRLIVYPQQYDFITLWDKKTERVLATFQDHGHFNHDPLWSIDGADFVMVIVSRSGVDQRMGDFFRVSNQGEVQQITNFKDMLDYVYIKNERRSPDGKQVAFWVRTEPGIGAGKWAVMNLETPTQLFCVEGAEAISIWSSPIWSPDSRYVIVANLDGSRDGPVILMDTQERRATEIAKDAVPFGWLVEP